LSKEDISFEFAHTHVRFHDMDPNLRIQKATL